MMGIIIFFTYLWKRIIEGLEKELVQTTLELELQQKITHFRLAEVIAWTLLPIGFTIYIYGIVNASPFTLFLIASCLIVIGYFVATQYRKQRLQFQKEQDEKRHS